MKNKSIKHLILFVVLMLAAAAILGISLFVQRKSSGNQGSVAIMKPDNIAVAASSGGGSVLTDKTQNYQIALPQDWYFEKSAGTGVTVYPNYDPAGKVVPDCKIMISALPNPSGADLNTWLEGYFSEDPTTDIEQQSVSGSEVSGQPAITWIGSENGVSTTLTYVAHGNTVYEIAPSLIEGSSSTSLVEASSVRVHCDDAFQSLLTNFNFLQE